MNKQGRGLGGPILRDKRWRNLLLGACLVSLCLGFSPASPAVAQLSRIIVGVDKTYRPFVFMDEKGQLVGFEIDLMNEVTKENGWEVIYEPTLFATLLPGVVTRLYDVAISCIFITPERQQQVNFTEPYYASGMWLITLKGSNIRSINDLTPAIKLGSMAGTAWETYAREHTTAQIVYSANVTELFDSLARGAVSAVINEREVLMEYLRTHPQVEMQIVGEPLTYDECGIATNIDEPRFLADLNGALTKIKANGSYEKIYRKWFGDLEPMVKPNRSTAVVNPQAGLQASLAITATTAAISGPVDLANFAGLYYLTLQTEPPAYEIATLTANGLWMGAQYSPERSTLSTTMPLLTYQGVWTVDTSQQIRATALNFEANSPTAGLARRSYEMTVDSAGQLNGNYTVSVYPLDVNLLSITTPSSQTVTIAFTGQRLSMTRDR